MPCCRLPAAAPLPAPKPLSPNQRAWARFRRNRLGYCVAVAASSRCWCSPRLAELVSNDRPLVARYDGQLYLPAVQQPRRRPPSAATSRRPTDWKDPFIAEQFAKPGNWAFFTLNPLLARHSATTSKRAQPGAAERAALARHRQPGPGHGGAAALRLSRQHLVRARADRWWARRIGIAAGALQGYFGGRVDLVLQRLIEIWGSMPELYLLIIFASIFEPSLLLLLVLLSLFGWMGLSDYVRAEFLRNRSLEFVKAARALGLSQPPDHLAPRAAELDDAGHHLPAVSHERRDPGADLARLPGPGRAGHRALARRPAAARARTTSMPGGSSSRPSCVLVLTMLLLTFIGDALRDAFDTRKS